MATTENPMLKKMSGHIGKQIVVRQVANKTIVQKYPDMSHRKLSDKQIRVNKIMAEAHYHAKTVLADEDLRSEAQVRLNVTRNKLYTALISEFFKTALAAK